MDLFDRVRGVALRELQVRWIVVGFLLFASAAAMAASAKMKKHADKERHFVIKYPPDWKRNREGKDFAVQLVSPDDTSQLGIMIQNLAEVAPAAAILDATEKSLGVANKVNAKDRTVKKARLKKVGADDGVTGAYSMGEQDAPVDQRIFVFVKGKRAYVLLETTLRDDDGPARKKVVDKMLDSFRIK